MYVFHPGNDTTVPNDSCKNYNIKIILPILLLSYYNIELCRKKPRLVTTHVKAESSTSSQTADIKPTHATSTNQ